jgi:dTDP-4-amino-4,6-dideoxygalactose transaminase
MEGKIPFMDLKRQYLQIKDEVLAAVGEVFETCEFTNGSAVRRLEEKFAAYCGTSYAVAVSNGTTALHLSMIAAGIGPGDEVILPANTFIATAWAPVYVGARPVFADCDPETWQIDPSDVESKITPRTRAIIGVHLYGQPCEIDKLKTIAQKHNLCFIEDAAQAHGAKYKGVRIGGVGEMACFSFYPGKNLGTYGEGGAVVTNDEKLANRIIKLRNHASVNKYYHEEIGYNYRMGSTEGAVLDIKLKYLDQWNDRRRKIAERYFTEIKNPLIKFQGQTAHVESVFHLFVATVEDRKKFTEFLQTNNVLTGLHYPVPNHLQKAFVYLNYRPGDFPHCEYLAEHCVSLPMFAELTEEEVNYVIEIINKFRI